jgi:hypothetical protein
MIIDHHSFLSNNKMHQPPPTAANAKPVAAGEFEIGVISNVE